jgi:hypothetical protein
MVIDSEWACLFMASFNIRMKIIFDIKISSTAK